MPNLFIAGVTGHRGSRLAEELIWGRHTVSGLVREGSENRLPQGCRPVPGNAWTAPRLVERLLAGDAYAQLAGVRRTRPAKAQQFREIDLKSCQESLAPPSPTTSNTLFPESVVKTHVKFDFPLI